MADPAIVQEVLEAERELYRAMVARDVEALGRVLAPDLVYVHSTAVAETLEAYLAGVSAGLYEYESVASHDAAVRVHGNVAFIDGICTMRVGTAGSPKELIHLRFVLAWARQPDEWRLVHRHATRVVNVSPA